MSCGICSKKFGKKGFKIRCNICEDWFHKTCVAISEEDFKQVKANKKSWSCGNCLDSDLEDTSDGQEGSEDSDDENDRGDSSAAIAVGKVSPVSGKTKGKISLEHILEKINVVIKQNNRLMKRIATAEGENKELKKQISELKMEQQQMKKDLEVFKSGRNRTQQDLLKKNVIISGLPTEEKELDDLKESVKHIGRRLNVVIKDEDVECVKIGKSESRKLKVIFKTEEMKESVMKAKRGKNLCTKDLGYERDETVYINHDLTIENQRLYKKTRQVKATLKFKYAWVSHGKIYLRKDENSRILHVTSEEYLDNLIVRKN